MHETHIKLGRMERMNREIHMRKLTVWFSNRVLHIHTPLGLITIRAGLKNLAGCAVDSIAMFPDDGIRRSRSDDVQLVAAERQPAL